MAISDRNIQSFANLLLNKDLPVKEPIFKSGFLHAENNQLLKVEASLERSRTEDLTFACSIVKKASDLSLKENDYLCLKSETKNYDPKTQMYTFYLPKDLTQQTKRLQIVVSKIANLEAESAKILAERILINVAQQMQVDLS